jgi:hypothetical protein
MAAETPIPGPADSQIVTERERAIRLIDQGPREARCEVAGSEPHDMQALSANGRRAARDYVAWRTTISGR